jgi:hypothetical protein
MILEFILVGLFLLISGYSIGRAGHVLFGDWKSPHHWIFGLLFILAGVVLDLDRTMLTLSLISFGVGCFISDIDDFLEFKIIRPDEHPERKFFGFD